MDVSVTGSSSDLSQLAAIGLTYVSDREPGIRRLKRGKGFCYKLPDGSMVCTGPDKARITALGLPPAYQNVWICLDPRGHLQATGLDARGRKQYRYHAEWQSFRSELKYDQLVAFGQALPRIRRRIQKDLSAGLHSSEAVLAALVALMDATHLRVGNEMYARENRTYGATTLLKRHMTLSDDGVILKFSAKGGKRVQHTIRHPRLQRIFEEIADLPGRRLFSFPDEDGQPHPVDSGRLNAYLADASGLAISAKTFRTWGGSLAAFCAASSALRAGEKIRIKLLTGAASQELQNTPAVCRNSYIHPAILSLAEDPEPLARLFERQGEGEVRQAGLKVDEQKMLAFLSDVAL
ncbi:DNA topoisomerase IB [Rhizobium sp. SSA_523]|uniref:DNA topoisomerase IB n=1 Tax=Rhizobium sp. SSA_523 TaxID=2952477 RepID=UPI002091962B|nr:DNA topoisomerase IB [Rhizobium sp. SSA_523]MCO5731721.1 DNA topoisomerase IB [Rhizobium sp. SSA_523]WKC22906.1 DNA topoisomerase IB [Rhizobium sp. SSA_523]